MKINNEYRNPHNQAFGEWLRIRMERKGVTLREVSKVSKLSYFKLRNIKERSTGVRLDMVEALSKYFNITISRFFYELRHGVKGNPVRKGRE